jgi:hypothetical protein
MPFVFTGYGGLVIALPLVSGIALRLAAALYWPTLEMRAWMIGLIFLASGFILWSVGKRAHKPLDRATEDRARAAGEEPVLELGHTLYGVRMEWWGVLYLVLGVVILAASAPQSGGP